MAKPEPWRLDAAAYPFETQIDTRFQDLDTLGHINNVAMAGIFETARIRFHHHLGRHPNERGVRWLVAALSLSFVQEAHFPAPVVIRCGLSGIGRTSWTILCAAFQKGECVATCDTVMVAQGAEGRSVLDDELRLAMKPHFVKSVQDA